MEHSPNLFAAQEWQELLTTLPQMSGQDIYTEGQRQGLFGDMQKAWGRTGFILEEGKMRKQITFAAYLESQSGSMRQVFRAFLEARLRGDTVTNIEQTLAAQRRVALRETIRQIQARLAKKN